MSADSVRLLEWCRECGLLGLCTHPWYLYPDTVKFGTWVEHFSLCLSSLQELLVPNRCEKKHQICTTICLHLNLLYQSWTLYISIYLNATKTYVAYNMVKLCPQHLADQELASDMVTLIWPSYLKVGRGHYGGPSADLHRHTYKHMQQPCQFFYWNLSNQSITYKFTQWELNK